MNTFTDIPIMKQYDEMKKKHPDAILLFRVGDFYETFRDDAITVSEILGLTLIRRNNGSAKCVELAGFPHHALDTYLPKLVRAGRRVAICEQLEDPKMSRRDAKYDTVELVTPNNCNPQYVKYSDMTLLFASLSEFGAVLNKLYVFTQICVKTHEIEKLAMSIGISPKRAFDECRGYNSVQLSLFDI